MRHGQASETATKGKIRKVKCLMRKEKVKTNGVKEGEGEMVKNGSGGRG